MIPMRHASTVRAALIAALPCLTLIAGQNTTGAAAATATTGTVTQSLLTAITSTTTIAAATTTTYYQPPLPTNSAYSDPNTFVLSPDFEITDVPQTREYFFDIGTAAGNPDGFKRQIYTVNGQFPGPLIECNEGDEIVVHVTNSLDEGQSIHWHGLYQRGTVHMDGITGVTQCPIPPGGTFTYRFKVEDQHGTFWWHSHYANAMADGIFGPLIVHSVNDPVKRGVDYDEDRVIMTCDWMHDQSSEIIKALLSPVGFRGTIATPQGDSILINGVGQANCSTLPEGECSPPALPEIHVAPNRRYRFRIINNSAHSMLRPSIDSHDLEVVEADSVAVYGPTLHEIPVAPAQRYSIIVNTDKGAAGDAFWLRINVAVECMQKVPQEFKAIFRYVDDGGSASTQEPSTQAWGDIDASDAACRDLDQLHNLPPRISIDAVGPAHQTYSMSSVFGAFVDNDGTQFLGFGFNNVTFKNFVFNPLLAVIQSGQELNGAHVASQTFSGSGPGHIILNNLDAPGLDHPYHLHGQDFQIIARGEGNITAEEFEAQGHWQTSNPPRRDTVFVPGKTWVALRIAADNPGVWAVHCHIGWHLAEGKLAAFVVQPDQVHAFDSPSDWTGMCTGDPNTIGPAKRVFNQLSPVPASRFAARQLRRALDQLTG
ncbi:hypothetical protein IAT38_001689 [Cryptococcus sp. DSM 104549]